MIDELVRSRLGSIESKVFAVLMEAAVVLTNGL